MLQQGVFKLVFGCNLQRIFSNCKSFCSPIVWDYMCFLLKSEFTGLSTGSSASPCRPWDFLHRQGYHRPPSLWLCLWKRGKPSVCGHQNCSVCKYRIVRVEIWARCVICRNICIHRSLPHPFFTSYPFSIHRLYCIRSWHCFCLVFIVSWLSLSVPVMLFFCYCIALVCSAVVQWLLFNRFP